MIFITLGSQKFQFNRLLRSVDRLVENGDIEDNIFAQIGCSDYEPHNYRYKKFLDRTEFADNIVKSDIVITHGGTGVVMEAVKHGKKVIAVPRLARYGEHVDDHQVQLLKQFEDMDIIEVCHDLDHLDETINRVRQKEYQDYVSNTGKIIESIETYLMEQKRK